METETRQIHICSRRADVAWQLQLIFSDGKRDQSVQSLRVSEGLSLENCTPIKVPQLPPSSCQMFVCKTCLRALCHAM